jgi:ribonucleoside-diphosphate reductase subunit M1
VIVSQKVIQGVYPGVTTSQLDELAAEIAATMATQHPDYSILAARISVSNLHKMTIAKFSDLVELFYHYKHPQTNETAPLVSQEVYNMTFLVSRLSKNHTCSRFMARLRNGPN